MKETKKKSIKFRHRYYKLTQPEFTTIRGAAQFKRLKVGQVVECDTKDGKFDAVVTGLEHRTIGSMTDEFLSADGSHPGCTVRDREDFARLVNSCDFGQRSDPGNHQAIQCPRGACRCADQSSPRPPGDGDSAVFTQRKTSERRPSGSSVSASSSRQPQII